MIPGIVAFHRPSASDVSSYQAVALGLSPVAYFPLTETTGDALDAVGTARLLVHSNAIRSGVVLANELNGYRMSARSDSYFPLLRGPDASFGNLAGDFSLSFVLKGTPPAGVPTSIVFSKEMAWVYWAEYGLIQSGGSIHLVVRNASADGSRIVDATASKNILDGVRHHLVFVKSGTRYRLYVDGSAVIDVIASGTPITGLGVLGISGEVRAGGSTSSNFIGDVAGVALYTKALSGADVLSMANSL